MLGAALYIEEGGRPGTGGVANVCIIVWSNGNISSLMSMSPLELNKHKQNHRDAIKIKQKSKFFNLPVEENVRGSKAFLVQEPKQRKLCH